MKSTLLAAIAYILILTNSYSQTNSKWFAHLSYTKTSDLSAWGSKIVVAGEYGVFIYDPDDASLSKYSKLNGLSSEKISSLQALRNTDAFILGFDTGEFDVVFSDSRVVNVKDIKNSSVSSLKNINCIAEYKNLIYLGTPFGIVVYDIENEEFGDTFFFGDNGSYIHVNDITFSGQDIFVATEEGVYKADAENPFLVDYKQWEKQKSIPTNSYNSIVGIGGKIIANNSESESVQYVLDDSTWDKAANQYARVTKMKSDGEFVSYSAAWSVHTFDKDLNKIETVSANTEIDFRANSSIWLNGHTWIATSSYGLVDKRDRVLYSTIPDGPSSNSSFRLKSGAKKLYLLYGGYLSDYKPLGNKSSYDTFEDGDWSFIDYSDILDSKDLVNVAIDPQDDKHIFVSSWNDGLIEMYENELVEQWNENNSAIQNQGEIHDSYKSFRIAGSAYDADGNLWIANAWYVDEPFVMKSANGDWYSFSVDRYIGGEDAGMSGICIDDNGNKWIGTRDEGIWVYNEGESLESSGDDKVSKFYTNQNRGNLPSERVNTVAIDKNNIAWIGTQAGLVVFSDIDDLHELYSSSKLNAKPIIIEEDGIGKKLMGNQKINKIVVDGSDKKWFATETGGAYYTSSDGQKTIHHFTIENSPLLSNNVLDIDVDTQNGRVYMLTSKGLVSFQGNATEGGSKFSKVFSYPNPVRPGYSGDIYIKGLTDRTNVKITDINGNLIFETTSEGGQAVWNGNSFSGYKAASGVYLVFALSKDGSETAITKILIVN